MSAESGAEIGADTGVIGAILLAAGGSTRLGQPKQLLAWRGQSLLRNAVTVALDSGVSPVVVVVGSRADDMAQEITGLPVFIAVNPDWETGMGSSLQVGLRKLEEIASPDAVLVLLCDQPLVTSASLRTLLASYDADRPVTVASEYPGGTLGPPCLFPRALFPRLRSLSGAQGARAILGSLPPGDCTRVPFPGGLQDVDTWADWERVKKEKIR